MSILVRLLLFVGVLAGPRMGWSQSTPEIPDDAPPPTQTPPARQTEAATPAPSETTSPAADLPPTEVAAPAPTTRSRPLRRAVSPDGNTGILRVGAADSVGEGVIRMSFGIEAFSVGTLFEDEDDASRVAGTLAISGSPFPYMEAWLATRATSTGNNQTNPQLLQALGDIALGLKGFYPVTKIASIGADFQLRLLSGVGDTSLDFGASEVRLRALLSTDFSKAESALPIRGHLNLGFTVDNSDNLIPEGEQLGQAERFALGINEFNRFGLGVGLEIPLKYVTPYIEYSAEFPIDYLASPGVVVRTSALIEAQTTGGVTREVARPAVQRIVPQVLTPGLRITAIPDLTIDLAVEVGITPESTIGVPAIPPYNVVLFASYALDPFAPSGPSGPPIAVPIVMPEKAEADPTRIIGRVLDKNTKKPIAAAIIKPNKILPVASDMDGNFTTLNLEPGPVTVTIERDGYETATAELTVNEGETAEVEVELAVSVRQSTLRGQILDDKEQPVAGATIELDGPTKTSLKSNEEGKFEVKAQSGHYSMTVNQEGFLTKGRELDLIGEETLSVDVIIRPRPDEVAVSVQGDRIILTKKVHFLTGEARLAPDAAALLDQVIDVLVSQRNIRKVRIEGHTDNVGGDGRNMALSRERANAVLEYMVQQGIDQDRLTSEGFGPTRPIAPNLTRRGREQNRRVEFYIVEQ